MICLLEYKDRHWLINNKREQAPPPALLSVYATRHSVPKLSRDDRKPLAVSAADAHNLFGHISQKAIAQLNSQVDGVNVSKQPEAPQRTECETCCSRLPPSDWSAR